MFVTGGVCSSLGKGILTASLGRLLQARGVSITIQKIDPYLNVDPGTLNPYEHGEVFVTVDGAETDLDLGHYERFTGITTTRLNNITAGRVFLNVLGEERKGTYLGKTVQMIPHVTNEIKRLIRRLERSVGCDIVLVEVGGTVGDIESQPFLEAIRQLRWELGAGNSVVVHLTLLPYLKSSGELKTKPTQHSVRTLQSLGIQPDVIVCRAEVPVPAQVRRKISMFCNVEPEAVIEARDVDIVYEVPLMLAAQGMDRVVLSKLGMPVSGRVRLDRWRRILECLKNAKKEVTIALVGKYVEHGDSYISIREALVHAGAALGVRIKIQYVHSEELNHISRVERHLAGVDGVLVAPGFGERGIEGKLMACQYARESGLPFLGICLGMQCAVIEFVRNVLGLEGANSTEFDPQTPHPVIDLMEEQKKVTIKGGTMRLGEYTCQLVRDSRLYRAYGREVVRERHRHRWEVNLAYVERLEQAGMRVVGVNPESGLVEAVELAHHPWFVGVQYHPEFASRLEEPHRLFVAFVEAALRWSNKHSAVVSVSSSGFSV